MKELICPNCNHVFTVDESGYNELLAQVRTKEFETSVKTAVAAALAESQRKADKAMADLREAKDKEITKRETALAAARAEKDSAIKAAVAEAVTEANKTIVSLRADARTFESEKTLAVERAVRKQKDTMKEEYDQSIRVLNAEHSKELAAMKAEVDEARSIKARLSTKMVGETLEQHCESEFNRIRSMAFPRAEFHKDNDTSVNGQKGDYIFRDFAEDGTEIVSIMFEMKNQSDDSTHTKKNSDFFFKLDRDRNAKKCEYAVLVSLLEPDSELYNQGIVDVSYEYPKMFVIRPQFFLAIIGLLRN
ncbi:MAG: DUF2130 domain-containing protein, partial [Eggerthellaceae bacterium]|nr:DUF2130 domain-containing protein [Eggerthellaceae bacterium]